LPLELVEQTYASTDTASPRKRKLTLESMTWLLIGKVVYNDKSMTDVVNLLDIVDREGKFFCCPKCFDSA